jgi:hypothetical protein
MNVDLLTQSFEDLWSRVRTKSIGLVWTQERQVSVEQTNLAIDHLIARGGVFGGVGHLIGEP